MGIAKKQACGIIRTRVENEVAGRALEALISTFHPDTLREIARDDFLGRMKKRDWPGMLLRPLIHRRILVILWDETRGASCSGYLDFPRRRQNLELFARAVGFDLAKEGLTQKNLDAYEAIWRARP